MVKLLRNRLFQILILGAFLRLFMLGSVPASLNWDEVSQGYTAYSVAHTGMDEWGAKLPMFFRSYGEWKSAVYIYLLVPLVKFFSLSPFIVRLPSAIFGVISIYLIYLICKKLYSENTALWSAFLMAVTPWSFFLSRPAFEANVALTLLLAGLYLFLTQKYVFSAIMFGLAPHTYNSAKIVVPILVVYLIWSTKLYKNLKTSFLYLGILAVFALPLLLNLFPGNPRPDIPQVSSPFFMHFEKLFRPIDKFAIRTYIVSSQITHSHLFPGLVCWRYTYLAKSAIPWRFYVSEYILVIIGIFALPKNKSNLYLLPFVLIILGIMPAALTRDPEHALRSLLVIPGFIILASIGFEYLFSIKYKYLKIGISILIIEIFLYMASYFTWYGPVYARDWQYGYPEVSAYLDSNASKYDHIVVTKWFGEPQLFLAFYGQWDPVWYQQQNKQNISYERSGKMWLDQLESYSLGKYTFKYISWGDEARDKKTLYIGKFDDFPGSAPLKTIYYPDGTVAFHIVEGDR
jgi:4-amino-4-deoxy-L-arabinose transferase-like glycosyltransferase